VLISQCFLGDKDRQEASHHTVPNWQKAHIHRATLYPICPLVSSICSSSAGATRQPEQGLQLLRCLYSTWHEKGLSWLLAEKLQRRQDPFTASIHTQVCGTAWEDVLLWTGPKMPKERDWVPFPTRL